MLTLSPVGLSTTALVANQLSVGVNIKEKLCRPFCVDSTVQPQVTVTYTPGTAIFNGTTVFVPIQAKVTIVTQGCNRNAITKLYTENFVVEFQGQTGLPTAVNISNVGTYQRGSDVRCGKAYSYTINDSLIITITPPAAAAG